MTDRPKHNPNSTTPVWPDVMPDIGLRRNNPELLRPVHIPAERDGVVP